MMKLKLTFLLLYLIFEADSKIRTIKQSGKDISVLDSEDEVVEEIYLQTPSGIKNNGMFFERFDVIDHKLPVLSHFLRHFNVGSKALSYRGYNEVNCWETEKTIREFSKKGGVLIVLY